METLADFIDIDVDILSIGLNPSPNSVLYGFPFATPQNRFWRALNQSKLVNKRYPPSVESIQALLLQEHIGFTDVVKRTTRSGSDLRVEDYRRWAPILRSTIDSVCPRIIWFHGKVAYRNFAQFGLGQMVGSIDWGEQKSSCAGAVIFISPNPSTANAAYSLAEITAWYDKLAIVRRRSANRRAL
ncbi:MAG TPA: mismatch-specific DNA-glycosylase [Gammaproteobacteria bacterium]|nr:mismatch-specific DNA-glycosylase [Gammaproteobacteria bacterium]|tara:strand:+ start:1666 stop:2220 length:555 start_codon:yes stop_codon:yes gene_type:complete